jgi:threonine synthase
VTTAVTARLYADGRIGRDETTVVCITGNGLKTTDALDGRFFAERAVKPKLAAFDEYIRELEGVVAQELELVGGSR